MNSIPALPAELNGPLPSFSPPSPYAPAFAAVSRNGLHFNRTGLIETLASFSTAITYFGPVYPHPRNLELSQQALYKLSAVYRRFLRPEGLEAKVNDSCLILYGSVPCIPYLQLATILAHEIEGVSEVDARRVVVMHPCEESASLVGLQGFRQATAQLLLATDRTVPGTVSLQFGEGSPAFLNGTVADLGQKAWIEELLASSGLSAISNLVINPYLDVAPSIPTLMDDESLQALIKFRFPFWPERSRRKR